MSEDANSQTSSTKTKSAHLSGLGYSAEMALINQPDQAITRLTQVNGIENEVTQKECCFVQPESDVSTPPGFGNVLVFAQQGVGGSGEMMDNLGSKKSKAKGLHVDLLVGSRVTRSQMRKAKTQATVKHSAVKKRGDGIKNVKVKHCDRQSIESTESMKKLAEEALRVGEMLGIKVIAIELMLLRALQVALRLRAKIGATKAE